MARLAVGVFYLVLALTLGIVYGWEWAAWIILVGVIPGAAVFYGAAYGGEFIAEQRLRPQAEAAPRRRVHLDPDHAKRSLPGPAQTKTSCKEARFLRTQLYTGPDVVAHAHDRRGRAQVDPLLGGRLRPAPLHAREGAHWGDREGGPQDALALRRPSRAAEPRRASPPRGPGRSPHGARRSARPLPRPLTHGSVPAGGGSHRARSSAPALRRGGGAAARVPRAHAPPGSPGRRRCGAARPARARAARPLLPAQAALALRLPPAPDELRRVRGSEAARGLLRAGGRGGVPGVRDGRAAALGCGLPGDRGAARAAARRGARGRPGRGRAAAVPARYRALVRRARRLPSPHALCLAKGRRAAPVACPLRWR